MNKLCTAEYSVCLVSEPHFCDSTTEMQSMTCHTKKQHQEIISRKVEIIVQRRRLDLLMNCTKTKKSKRVQTFQLNTSFCVFWTLSWDSHLLVHQTSNLIPGDDASEKGPWLQPHQQHFECFHWWSQLRSALCSYSFWWSGRSAQSWASSLQWGWRQRGGEEVSKWLYASHLPLLFSLIKMHLLHLLAPRLLCAFINISLMKWSEAEIRHNPEILLH